MEDDGDEDFSTESESEEMRLKMFDQFCEDFLELDQSHVNSGLIEPFEYFEQLMKTAFFWKKMFFEVKKQEMIEHRR